MKRPDSLPLLAAIIFGVFFFIYVALISQKLPRSSRQEMGIGDKKEAKFISWKSVLPD